MFGFNVYNQQVWWVSVQSLQCCVVCLVHPQEINFSIVEQFDIFVHTVFL
jgi:hypothetical protein